MSITRRTFLLKGGLSAALMAVTPPLLPDQRPQSLCRAPRLLPARLNLPLQPQRPVLRVATLQPFVDPLPVPPLARSTQRRAAPHQPGLELPYHRIEMAQTEHQVHRDMKPTRFWTYNGSMPGPTLEARSGEGLLVEWVNALPQQHFLPIDYRLHGAGADQPQVRTVVHLHGGKTPHASDGYPEEWYTPGHSALCHYPNRQDAAALWYHDHAMGINRLNMYAGLFGAYLIRDAAEEALDLPRGEFEIPLLLCDRQFFRDDHQLCYPVSPYPEAPWVWDIEADGTLVNGKLFPYLEVQPRAYRLRLLGASNSRVFHLALSNGQPLLQIGTDQGLLPAPVAMQRIILAPGERIDLVVDFAALGGQTLELRNEAIGILQFRVAAGTGKPWQAPAVLRPVPRLPAARAVKTRQMTLGEHDSGTGDPVEMLLNDTPWMAPVTEKPRLDTVEIWEFLNLTDDIHPMHLHLVRFQLLDRQVFHPPDYLRSGKVVLTGPVIAPRPEELGWKDTIQAYPGMITRIIVRFEGYTGRYLWHCHILEHEANDMMRPFEVVA
jgi:spore coat protein A, manganese oxidase